MAKIIAPTDDDIREIQRKIYSERIDQMEKKHAISSQELNIPNKLSTGLLCFDFLTTGGIAGGCMYQVSGLEKGAKCLVPKTLVNTNSGFLDLGEVIDEDLSLGNHAQYDLLNSFITNEKGNSKISHVYKGKGKTIKLVTHSGFDIEGTYIHPMLVMNDKLDFVWKNLIDITLNDWIVTHSKNVASMFGTNAISKDMATIMGYLTANGVKQRLHSGDVKVVDNFNKVVKNVTGVAPTQIVQKNKVSSYIISGSGKNGVNSKDGSRWNFYDKILVPLGYSGSHSKYKSIPLSIRTAPKEILHEFLESYFECDSGIDGTEIKLITASKKLARQLHCILFQVYDVLGNKTKIKAVASNSKSPTVRNYYQISIGSLDAIKFLDSFKRAKVQKYSLRIRALKIKGSEFKSIPYVRSLTKDAYNLAKVSTKKGNSSVKSIKGNIIKNYWMPDYIKTDLTGNNTNHYASEYHFNNVDWDKFTPHLALIDENLSSKIDFIRKSGFRFQKVVSVTKKNVEKLVLDVTVPDTHSFIANCLVSHNTTLASTIVGAAIRKQVPIILDWDVENAMSDPEYAQACMGFNPKDIFIGPNKRARLYQEAVLEDFYNTTRSLMRSLPDKMYRSDAKQWFHVFDADQDGRKNMGDFGYKKYNKQMYTDTGRMWCETDLAGLQGLVICDSYPALVVSKLDENEEEKILPAMNARAFADNIKKVVGVMKKKGFSILGTNQIRTNPMPKYGQNPEYEPGGNALAFYASCRLQNRPRSVPNHMFTGKNADGNTVYTFGQEPSVYGKGLDRYTYIKVKNTKNKLGTPLLEAEARVWYRDGNGTPHGYDLAYDTYQYLDLTGRFGGSPKKGGITINIPECKNLPKMDWNEFKLFILCHTDPVLMKRAKDTLNLKTYPDIRKNLFKEIRNKSAYKMLVESKSKVTEDMEA